MNFYFCRSYGWVFQNFWAGSKSTIVEVDEIELGTDSDELLVLFKSNSEELIKDIKVIITTHHKRLAAVMASDQDVELIAALYDEENRTN